MQITQSLSLRLYKGQGQYSTVYVSKASFSTEGYDYYGRWVLKIPIVDCDEKYPLNIPERAIRKKQALNPKYPAIQVGTDWLMPFFGEKQATDLQIASLIISNYQET